MCHTFFCELFFVVIALLFILSSCIDATRSALQLFPLPVLSNRRCARSPASKSKALSLSRRLPGIPRCWRTTPFTLLPCTHTHTLHTFFALGISLRFERLLKTPWLYRTGGPCGIEAFTYVQYAFISYKKNALIMSPSLVNVHFLDTSIAHPSAFPLFSHFFKFVV